MGKTPKPLKILYIGLEIPDCLRMLQLQGHQVDHYASGVNLDYDLILAPQACRFVPGMEFLLDEVVKGARRLKYPKEKT